MARMIAPSGVEVNASEADERVFLAAGYAYVDVKPAPRKRTSRAKAKPKPKQQEE